MKMKDKTSRFGRVVIFIPLILIFLTAADSALACPGHTSGVRYRTRSINNSSMGRTIITYRAPATYKRCGDNLYNTMGVKYVAVRRGAVYSDSSARYVAVRKAPRVRYVAVNDAPRYVAVRRTPAYIDSGTTYVVARSGYRRGNGVVAYVTTRNADLDEDQVRYIAARNYTPRSKYVAVRNVDIDDDDVRYVSVRQQPVTRTKYVAVRKVDLDDDDVRYVAVRDAVPQTKYVALRDDDIDDDDDDIAFRSASYDDDNDDYVAVRNASYVDHDIVMPARNVVRTNYVEYADTAYLDKDVSVTPEVVGTTTIKHVRVTDDDDIDDLAFLDGGGATYVAADDIENACTRSVSYVPVENMSNVAVRYASFDDDADLDEIDMDDVTVTRVPTRHVSVQTVRYVPVEDLDTVSYVPASDVRYVDAYDTDDVETVSYVPAQRVQLVDTNDVDLDDCPMAVSGLDESVMPVANDDSDVVFAKTHFIDDSAISVDGHDSELVAATTEPMADDPEVVVAEAGGDLVAVSTEPITEFAAAELDSEFVAATSRTQQIASEYGHRDGFEDGREAALEGDVYHPENSGDYQKATEGYEDTFGDKDVYKDAYRSSYLDGYRAGFESLGAA